MSFVIACLLPSLQPNGATSLPPLLSVCNDGDAIHQCALATLAAAKGQDLAITVMVAVTMSMGATNITAAPYCVSLSHIHHRQRHLTP